MRRTLLASTAAAALLLTSLGGTAASSAQPASAASGSTATVGASDGWIVVLRDGAAPGRVAAEHRERYGAQVGHLYRHALRGYSARMSDTAAKQITRDSRVLFVQPDGVVHTTAPGGKGKPGGGTTQPMQTLPTGINRANADVSSTLAGDEEGVVGGEVGVDVAVIDTGIDLDHPDLNVHTAGAKNCSTGGSADDGNGHGTHVAGTIGALDNTTGVVGMAPGARVWPVRVLDNRGSGTWSSVICGIDYVAANADQIEVANMSLGGSGTDDGNCGRSNNDAMHTAICSSVAAGVTYVVAAGNDAADAEGFVPAAYDEVVTVSALADFDGAPGGVAPGPFCRADIDDTFADFSNYGADVDLIAPGVCISSTWKGGGYKQISGTSMASPHVAGGAALYLATNPGASPTQVKSALQTAGTLDWNDLDDPDNTQEKLLDVTGF